MFRGFFFSCSVRHYIGAGGIGAPIVLANCKVDDRVLCASPIFILNRLLIELYKQETEIRWRKDDGYIKKQTDIDRHSSVSPSTRSQPLDPPNFSLPTTFKLNFEFYDTQIKKKKISDISTFCWLWSQNRTKRLKKTKNIFYKCVLEFHPILNLSPVWEAPFCQKSQYHCTLYNVHPSCIHVPRLEWSMPKNILKEGELARRLWRTGNKRKAPDLKSSSPRFCVASWVDWVLGERGRLCLPAASSH